MKLTVCSKLCVECPFSKNSLKGWLGAHTLDDIVECQENEDLFSCHMARKEDMCAEDIESGKVKICRGYVASATKSNKIFGEDTENGPELMRLQKLIREEDKEDPDIILSIDEFLEHHGRHNVMKMLNISKEEWMRRLGYVAPTE